MQETPLKEMLRKRGMTYEQGLKASGLTRRTFDILIGGGVTLPQLALKVGKGLKLTQEEVKLLGQPLDKASWDAKKLPYKAVDVDPKWYKKLRGRGEVSDETWLNREAMLKTLLERGMDQKEFYALHPELHNANQANEEDRRQLISQMEAELGLPEGSLATSKLTKGQMEIMYLVKQAAVEELMRQKGLSRIQLARAMWMPGNDERTPSRRMSDLWQHIEAGEVVSKARAELLARTLEVEVEEIAEVKIRTKARR